MNSLRYHLLAKRTRRNMPFLNKVVLITGAGTGIGQAAAIIFAKKQARLALVDDNLDSLKKSSENCEKISRTKVLSIVADVSKDEDVKRIVEVTVKQYGRIDVLVNCASVAGLGSIFDENIMDNYDRTIGVNLRGMLSLTHAASSALIESKGNVVNITSVTSNAFPNSVAKGGVNHLTKATAVEFAPHGVRVNTVMSGPMEGLDLLINSTYGDVLINEAAMKEAANVPLKRYTKPEDVGELITFLASDAALSITGSSYVVDGGYMLQH